MRLKGINNITSQFTEITVGGGDGSVVCAFHIFTPYHSSSICARCAKPLKRVFHGESCRTSRG